MNLSPNRAAAPGLAMRAALALLVGCSSLLVAQDAEAGTRGTCDREEVEGCDASVQVSGITDAAAMLEAMVCAAPEIRTATGVSPDVDDAVRVWNRKQIGLGGGKQYDDGSYAFVYKRDGRKYVKLQNWRRTTKVDWRNADVERSFGMVNLLAATVLREHLAASKADGWVQKSVHYGTCVEEFMKGGAWNCLKSHTGNQSALLAGIDPDLRSTVGAFLNGTSFFAIF